MNYLKILCLSLCLGLVAVSCASTETNQDDPPVVTEEPTEHTPEVTEEVNAETTETTESTTEDVVEEASEEPISTQQGPVKKEEIQAEKAEEPNFDEMVMFLPFKKNYEMKVGDKAYYSGAEHGSVGTQVNAWSADSEVLKLLSKSFEYDNPENAEMSGGDAGSETYIFEAMKPGKGVVKIEKSYRGDVTDEIELIIEVSE